MFFKLLIVNIVDETESIPRDQHYPSWRRKSHYTY